MLDQVKPIDVLIKAHQPPAQYYIAAQAYVSAPGTEFDNTTTIAILEYNKGSSSKPWRVEIIMPPKRTSSVLGVFTTDFPAKPPVAFDYTGTVSRSLWTPISGTKVYRLKYGSKVQIVLQSTNIVASENHPIHLHGYDFYILAEGFGNFNLANS
ncbi:laccase-12-like protein isoform X2 [Tanacetum coccineum]